MCDTEAKIRAWGSKPRYRCQGKAVGEIEVMEGVYRVTLTCRKHPERITTNTDCLGCPEREYWEDEK